MKLNISKKTMTVWGNFCSEVCSQVLLNIILKNFTIGGENKIVKIDETVFQKKESFTGEIITLKSGCLQGSIERENVVFISFSWHSDINAYYIY